MCINKTTYKMEHNKAKTQTRNSKQLTEPSNEPIIINNSITRRIGPYAQKLEINFDLDELRFFEKEWQNNWDAGKLPSENGRIALIGDVPLEDNGMIDAHLIEQEQTFNGEM